MWTNYPEPVVVSLTRYTGPSLAVPVAVAKNSQVHPTTASTSQGSPTPSVTKTDNRQLTPDSPDPIDRCQLMSEYKINQAVIVLQASQGQFISIQCIFYGQLQFITCSS